MPVQPEAFFLSERTGAIPNHGQRFCVLHTAAKNQMEKGLVVYVHPLAEEMNKARRMAAVQARDLAQAGFTVLQIDLLGCGDSSGDFGDATWQDWVNDVVQACHWLKNRHTKVGQGNASLWLWGLRAGCLVAVDAAKKLDEPCNFLFWNPPAAGKQLLQQFLRLKVAGEMLGGQSKGVMESMRQQLADGSPVEIAGYLLSPSLAAGLEQAILSPPDCKASACRLEWFEISTRDDACLNPISEKMIAQWQQSGFEVASHLARGPAFWQTTEIELAPELLAATVVALSDLPA